MLDAESPAEDEWTPDERRRLAALVRERSAGVELEMRTLASLRGRGLLAGGGRPRARRRLVLAIAASALFAAGAGAGYLAAMRAVAAREATRAADVLHAEAPSETLAVHASGGRQVTWY